MPYPPTSVSIRVICGRLFSARSFCAFRAFCGNLFLPTDFSLGGYGILPYPRHQLWDILPQNTPNSQNLLLRCPPTDFTDLHRYLGCAVLPRNSQNPQNWAAWVWQGCHTLLHLCASVLICGRLFSARGFRAFRAFCGNIFSPTDFSLGGYGILPYPRHQLWDILPQNTPNSQNLLLRCPPTDFTDLHRYLWCAVLPQNSQNAEFGSVGMAGMPYPPNLCASVLICGRLFSARSFCEFRAFCGNIFSPTEFTEFTEFGSVGMAGMPYPPNLCSSVSSVGGSSLQEVLCIRCIPWELLHRLFCWCSRDSCTPWRNPRK